MKGLVLYALLEAFVLDFGMHLLSYAVGLITGSVSYTHLDVYKRQE